MDVIETICKKINEGNKDRTYDDSFVVTDIELCKAETCNFYVVNSDKRKFIGLENNERCMGLPSFYYTDGRGDKDCKLCNLFYGGEEAMDIEWVDLKKYLNEEEYSIYLKFKPSKLIEHIERL